MKLGSMLPKPDAIGREVVILIAGALIAATLMRMWPAGRKYIADGWTPPPAP